MHGRAGIARLAPEGMAQVRLIHHFKRPSNQPSSLSDYSPVKIRGSRGCSSCGVKFWIARRTKSAESWKVASGDWQARHEAREGERRILSFSQTTDCLSQERSGAVDSDVEGCRDDESRGRSERLWGQLQSERVEECSTHFPTSGEILLDARKSAQARAKAVMARPH